MNITGEKHFANLSTTHLLGIKAINEIDINDFVILSRHEAISQEITFEDLEIGEIFQVRFVKHIHITIRYKHKILSQFQIDGNITGINVSSIESLLNETNSLLSNVIFENVTVVGNIVLNDSINAKAWSDLDDLLLKTEKNAVIIGYKRFRNDVNIKSNATIKSRQINDHIFSEFVTLNTKQQFPRKYNNN